MITVSRTAITLFGVQIHFYGLLIVTGILLAVLLAMKREKRLGLPAETTLDLALCCIPAALIGARAYYVLFSLDAYASGPWWKVFAIWEGGMAIYGGILAGILAGFIYSRKKKISFFRLADLAAPSIALGQAIGRWGNFVNQEAYGAVVLNPRAQFFPNAVNISGIWHYATFFYESVWCFGIVISILLLEKKKKFSRSGDIFLAYVFLYALERGVVEGLRTDSLYWGPLRVSQMLSLLAALAIAILMLRRTKPRWRAAFAPVFLIGALVSAVLDCFWGVFAFSACALVCAIYTYLYIQKREKNQCEI